MLTSLRPERGLSLGGRSPGDSAVSVVAPYVRWRCSRSSRSVGPAALIRTREATVAPSVLIVEDEEAVAFTLREILAQEGYTVQDVGNTEEALVLVERERFDVALLDLRVGEDSGLTVLARLKE